MSIKPAPTNVASYQGVQVPAAKDDSHGRCRAGPLRRAASTVTEIQDRPRGLADLFSQRLHFTYVQILHAADNPAVAAIHDLRVAIRRSGEIIHVLIRANVLARRPARRLLRTLQRIRRVAGDIRDLDVLRSLAEQSPSPPGSARRRRRLLEYTGRRRATLLKKLRRRLQRVSGKNPFAFLEDALASARGAPELERRLARALAGRIADNGKKFRRAGARALRERSPELAHRARIAGKRWRYACEPATQTGLADGRKLIDQLKHLQKTTGELHDVCFALASLAAPEQQVSCTAARAKKPGRESLWPAELRRRFARLLQRTLSELAAAQQWELPGSEAP